MIVQFLRPDFFRISSCLALASEVDETYHPLRGPLREYELIYVVSDERDVVGLCSHDHSEQGTSTGCSPRLTCPPNRIQMIR